jgi:osmotically-inducible protein OsmY
MKKPNNILQRDVVNQLEWDMLLDSTRVVVNADNGVITLTGTVPTYKEFLLAEDDAGGVGGVTQVDNQLLVGPVGEAIADTAIATACFEALDSDKMVPDGSVDVDVKEGWVTLTGEVGNHFQRVAAKYAVARVPGVVGVTDKVTISSKPVPSDLSERIATALKRNALLEDADITVTNAGSTVYLDGKVASFAARQKAEDVAWSAPGVTDIVDRTTILP